jgi:cytochrome c-type biogenesis protein CcmE
VKEGTVRRDSDQQVTFVVMDAQDSIEVSYKGLLPDLFREGQGIVAEGVLESPSMFRADTVLAKHDENYMPREVADTLKRQGHWQGEANAAPQTQ